MPISVFFIHAGDYVSEVDSLRRTDGCMSLMSLNACEPRLFWKTDIINSVSQMKSIEACGIKTGHGVLSGRKSLWALLSCGLRLRRLVKKEGHHVVHALWGSTTALMAVIFSPVPVVVSFCGSDLMGDKDSNGRRTFAGALNHLLCQVAAIRATGIITKSAQLKGALWKRAQHRAHVIPNGVDLQKFHPLEPREARKKLGWDEDTEYVLFFPGLGGTVKDPVLAERAFQLVQRARPGVQLVKVSGVPHETLVFYYAAASAMLLTSLHEGSNNSVKEALACGLPIVSVDCGDCRTLLSGVDNCAVVGRRSAAELADRLIEVLAAGRRTNGRQRVAALSEERIASQVCSVYQQVLNRDLV